MTTLTLVRHGETEWNRERRIQGASDIPLNETGRAQARTAAELLAEEHDEATPVVIVASDLSRARETAAIIAEVLDADSPRIYPELRERSYGDAEGLTIEDFLERWGDWHTARIPGAEESPVVRRRAILGIQRVVRDIRRDTAPQAARVIAVSHGALIREVIRHTSGDTLPLPEERLMNGSAHRFLFERERMRLLSYAAVVPVASDL